jgi:hypothetical protein
MEKTVLPRSCVFRIGVHNWTDFFRKKAHPAAMSRDRIREITTEMCDLLNAQTELLRNSTTFLSSMSREEMDRCQQRNNRLRQLGAELSELDVRHLDDVPGTATNGKDRSIYRSS